MFHRYQGPQLLTRRLDHVVSALDYSTDCHVCTLDHTTDGHVRTLDYTPDGHICTLYYTAQYITRPVNDTLDGHVRSLDQTSYSTVCCFHDHAYTFPFFISRHTSLSSDLDLLCVDRCVRDLIDGISSSKQQYSTTGDTDQQLPPASPGRFDFFVHVDGECTLSLSHPIDRYRCTTRYCGIVPKDDWEFCNDDTAKFNTSLRTFERS
mmetsp:Transcript_32210/g.78559  ORF Transcript_32210/g.78559 Transcript_32210/m.78559 type:complete len:207 (+) Transcript_32210:1827-2447(+)